MKHQYFFKIPYSQVKQANDLAVELCGVPLFAEDRTRGTDRASAFAYSHGILGDEKTNELFVAAFRKIGGEATRTDDKRLRTPVDPSAMMRDLGDPKRPDLEKLTVEQLKTRAAAEGVTLEKSARKSEILDAFEAPPDVNAEVKNA